MKRPKVKAKTRRRAKVAARSRGRKAAPVVGAYLARQGLIPDLVLCSTAQRALETLDIASAGWPTKPVVKKLKSLSAGKMGYSTTEVGDMVVDAL